MSGSEPVGCRMGCCPGCQDCFGMSLGCHQAPCRCALPCTCRFADEDTDSKWRDGCERHTDAEDARRYADMEPQDEGLSAHSLWCATNGDSGDPCDCGGNGAPCPVCRESGPCGFDAEGRPLIHLIPEDAEA